MHFVLVQLQVYWQKKYSPYFYFFSGSLCCKTVQVVIRVIKIIHVKYFEEYWCLPQISHAAAIIIMYKNIVVRVINKNMNQYTTKTYDECFCDMWNCHVQHNKQLTIILIALPQNKQNIYYFWDKK